MKFKQENTGSNYDWAALTRFQEYNKHFGKCCVNILLRLQTIMIYKIYCLGIVNACYYYKVRKLYGQEYKHINIH